MIATGSPAASPPGSVPSNQRWGSPLPAIAVLLAFLATALIVPVLAPVGIGDDWVYVRSVEILVTTGQLRILDLSVVTLVAQVLWGALFGSLFGVSFGVLRVATVVVVAAGGLATFGVARQLGAGPGLSALAMAAYLFQPLAFVLAFTFMTDPYFTAVMMIAAYCAVRGLRGLPDATLDWRWLLLGSLAASVAFLVRQQGILIPLAVVTVLVLRRQLPFQLASLRTLAVVVAAPLVTVAGYYLWLSLVHGVPEQQSEFTARVLESGLFPSLLLVARMVFIAAMYIGLFALPFTVAALPSLPRACLQLRPASLWLVATAILMLGGGIWHFDQLGYDLPPMPRMPYLPQYLGPTGLGPSDLIGFRPWLVSWETLNLLTVICAGSTLAAVILVARRMQTQFRQRPDRGPGLLVVTLLLTQVAGSLPPSFHFSDWIISVDRYLLPLLPLTVCLLAWALSELPVARPAAWGIVAVAAWISIAGTRDQLMYQSAVWAAAERQVAAGVPRPAIDAGAAWDGYYLYDYSIANNLDQQTPGGPWWTDLFGPATTSDVIISMNPVIGYDTVEVESVPLWLGGQPAPVYVVKREGYAPE